MSAKCRVHRQDRPRPAATGGDLHDRGRGRDLHQLHGHGGRGLRQQRGPAGIPSEILWVHVLLQGLHFTGSVENYRKSRNQFK